MSRFLSIHTVLVAGVFAAGAIGCSSEAPKAPDRGTGFPPSSARADTNHTAVVPKTPATTPEPSKEIVPTDKEPELVVPKPETFSEFYAEGKRLLGEGELTEAVAHFREASEMQPKNASAKIQLARARLAMGDLSEARTSIEEAVELAPDSSFAWNTMGRIELAEDDIDAAIASFERATEENPDNSYAWNNLGYVYLEQEMYEEASVALESATSGSNPTAYMWNNLGMAYEHLDFIVEARAAYRQGAEAGSKKSEANLERLEGVVSLVVESIESSDAGASEFGDDDGPKETEEVAIP